MLVGYKLESWASLAQSKLSSNVAIREKNEHIRNEGFLLCSADSLPYSLCDSTSLHDTLCAPLRIGKKKYFRQTFRRCLIPLRPPAPSYPHRNTRRERLYPPSP